jgi:hypothetical protein
VAAGRTIEPVPAVLALRVRKSLFFLALGTLAVHLAMGNVFIKDQAAFRTDLGVPAMIRSLASRCRADIDRMTIVTPVVAARHLFTYRAFFHQNTSGGFFSDIDSFIYKIINSRLNCQHVIDKLLIKQGIMDT